MPVYYCETGHRCGLIEAKNKDKATKEFILDIGRENLGNAIIVRLATKRDIDWVRVMGGKAK